MASATAVRSLTVSCPQTCGLVTVCMSGPPSCGYSLEGGHQFRNSSRGQDGRFTARFAGKVGAADRDVAELAGSDLDLTMANVSGQLRQSCQLENPTIQRMARIGDSNLALAHLRNQRCITLAGVCRCRRCRSGSS